jgi:hypothetical protein
MTGSAGGIISAVLLPAAVLNILWGGLAVLFSLAVFRLVGMEVPNYLQIWQRVGSSGGYAVASSARCATDPQCR